MMELTRKGEYAIRGIVFLAQQPPGEMVLMSDLAAATDAPAAFMAKILQAFVKQGIVRSFRGAKGGFTLARPAGSITLREIVESVEGPIVPNRCLTGRGACERDGGCNVHPVWKRVQAQVISILDGVTIAELARGHDRPAGKSGKKG
ncbi:MAG TPA: Rrf2 family transcriptional regulator [Candidatus Deferrimicrobiaceae bacterium]|jgi:Rrf2 family protein